MAKRKCEKLDGLVQYAKAYAQSPKSYETRGPLLCACLMLAGVGILLYGIYNAQGAMEKNAEIVTIKLAEWTLFGAVGVVAIAMAFLLILVQSYIKVAYETVQRLNEIKQVLIANADVLKGADALKLDDITPPPPTAEQKYMKRFSSRDLSWGWWLLVVGMFVCGVLLMAAFLATFKYPDFNSFVRQYVKNPGNLVLAGLLLMLGAGNVMGLRGRRQAKLAEKAENAKKGIDAEDAPSECSSEQGGEDARRSGSGGWWNGGDRTT